MRQTLALLLLAPLLAIAQGDGPVPPLTVRALAGASPPATLKINPATGITLGTLRVRFEETRISELKKIAGPVVVDQEEDASESTTWICFTIPEQPDAARLWILFQGTEEDGRVYGVHALRLAPGAQPVKRCPLLPGSLRPVTFDHGIRLGLSAEQVTAKLGQPTRKKAGWWQYLFEEPIGEMVDGKESEFTLLSGVDVRFKGGFVDAIRASQNTTN